MEHGTWNMKMQYENATWTKKMKNRTDWSPYGDNLPGPPCIRSPLVLLPPPPLPYSTFVCSTVTYYSKSVIYSWNSTKIINCQCLEIIIYLPYFALICSLPARRFQPVNNAPLPIENTPFPMYKDEHPLKAFHNSPQGQIFRILNALQIELLLVTHDAPVFDILWFF